MKETNFSITNKTRGKVPRVFFEKIKDAVVGKNYSLSLVFIGETTSQKLNKQYRQKDKATNVLSFPLTENSGEIFITPKVAKKEGHSVGFLFIHGLLHLKGYDHGDTMERAEEKIRKQFGV